MVCKGVLELLNVLASFCHKLAPSLIRIKFIHPQRVTFSRQTVVSKIIWSIVYILLFILSVVQLSQPIELLTEKSLIAILFHGFMVIICCSGAAVVVVYQNCPSAFCYLLNSMLNFPNGLVSTHFRTHAKNCIIGHMALALSTAFVVTFLIFIPAFTLMYPCLYENRLFVYLFGPCVNVKFQVSVFILLVLFMIPFAASTPLIIVSSVVTVKELTDNLRDLQKLVTVVLQQPNVKLRRSHSFEIALCYRKVQLFAIICNECYKFVIWPVVEFSGSLIMISCLYSLLVFDEFMTKTFMFALSLILATAVFVVCFILDMGSRSLMISSKMLIRIKQLDFGEKWTRKFYQSSQPIALKVGSFHKMDRERGLSLLRFILQRTIFLVLKTKEAGLT